ncbi:hypothetical protein [Cohnella silvisoli]|uniref:DUF421 domain-containing protein n=1 Tax=Cohnella silvisoli TaxID=2873699 RepID=A0ABV1KNX9_9BACL|nr:hypothetical protein [Cohnella silvisoli]MCD9020944.1 hypothetical protein [Cohnella silvisoli]
MLTDHERLLLNGIDKGELTELLRLNGLRLGDIGSPKKRHSTVIRSDVAFISERFLPS